jgi:hypothetical protein
MSNELVPFLVPVELPGPKVAVCFRKLKGAPWTSVPEATVDEDGNLFSLKNELGFPR